jgi:hypothetical protein
MHTHNNNNDHRQSYHNNDNNHYNPPPPLTTSTHADHANHHPCQSSVVARKRLRGERLWKGFQRAGDPHRQPAPIRLGQGW